MRPLHLLGLMAPEYRFYAPDGAPLVLPGAIASGDHEIILAFYHQVMTDRLVPRVEVDWYTMLLDPSRRYLEHILGQRGSSGVLLVVKVREKGVDLREIVEHPVIRSFEYVAVSNVHPGGGEELRTLLALTRDVTDRAEDLYDEVADRLALRMDGWRLIGDFVQTLQNPIDVLETVNALIEIQLEKNPPEEQRKRILQRMLIRQLELRPAAELCALTWMATKGFDIAQSKLGTDATIILSGLQAQGLLREKKLQQWAKYLEHNVLWEGIFATGARLPTDAQLTVAWADRVREAIRETGQRALFQENDRENEIALWNELNGVFQDAEEGKLARARERLQTAERRINVGFFSASMHAAYWYARGSLELSEGALERAEASLRDALQFAQRGKVNAVNRGRITHGLGEILFTRKKYEEAESTVREALRLLEEGGETSAQRGITMHTLGRVLLERQKYEEAESTFREALRLGEEGGDPPESLDMTKDLLNKVLQKLGKSAKEHLNVSHACTHHQCQRRERRRAPCAPQAMRELFGFVFAHRWASFDAATRLTSCRDMRLPAILPRLDAPARQAPRSPEEPASRSTRTAARRAQRYGADLGRQRGVSRHRRDADRSRRGLERAERRRQYATHPRSVRRPCRTRERAHQGRRRTRHPELRRLLGVDPRAASRANRDRRTAPRCWRRSQPRHRARHHVRRPGLLSEDIADRPA